MEIKCSWKDCIEAAYTIFGGNAVCRKHYEEILKKIEENMKKQEKLQSLMAQLNAPQGEEKK